MHNFFTVPSHYKGATNLVKTKNRQVYLVHVFHVVLFLLYLVICPFFISYLVAPQPTPQPTFGQWRGVSLTWLMLITACDSLFDAKITL